MKKTALLFLLAIMTLFPSAMAQHRHGNSRQMIRAYPAVGFTASQIRGDELRGFKKWGFTAGVGAEISLSDNNLWKATLETDFSQRGSYNNTNDPYSIWGLTLNYVDIPLSVHFTDPYGGMSVGIGLVYSRLVQQPHGELFYKPNVFIPDTSNLTFLKNDLAPFIDLRFPLWEGLTLNLRYQVSIIPVKKGWQFTEFYSANPNNFHTWSNDCYNSSVMVRLIYVFGDQPQIKNTSKKKKNKR